MATVTRNIGSLVVWSTGSASSEAREINAVSDVYDAGVVEGAIVAFVKTSIDEGVVSLSTAKLAAIATAGYDDYVFGYVTATEEKNGTQYATIITRMAVISDRAFAAIDTIDAAETTTHAASIRDEMVKRAVFTQPMTTPAIEAS